METLGEKKTTWLDKMAGGNSIREKHHRLRSNCMCCEATAYVGLCKTETTMCCEATTHNKWKPEIGKPHVAGQLLVMWKPLNRSKTTWCKKEKEGGLPSSLRRTRIYVAILLSRLRYWLWLWSQETASMDMFCHGQSIKRLCDWAQIINIVLV